MKKILILYFSGAGATKKLAERMLAALRQACEAELFSVEEKGAFQIEAYDALVIGTPVYHAAPARGIAGYLGRIPPLGKQLPAFVFNTRGMMSCNTNRILARLLRTKNIITVMDRAYRSPASDGSLLVPSVRRFFAFEEGVEKKIISDCEAFVKLLQNEILRGYLPRFRFSSILNAPNRFAGQHTTLKIYLHREGCVKCGRCVEYCPHKALSKDASGYPVFPGRNCENCYRCVRHCPGMALSLWKGKRIKRVLEYDDTP